jgi:hypothetical protein
MLLSMPKNITNKNEKKLKIFLEKKLNDVKPNNTKITKPGTSTRTS